VQWGKTVHHTKLHEGPEDEVCSSLSLKFGKQYFRAQGHEENTPCTFNNKKLKILPTFPTRSTIACTTIGHDFSSQPVIP